MVDVFLASDDRYLDADPIVLLTGAAILVGLLILCLVAEKAIGWFRSRQ
ncbi:MAG: hypothetical protein ABW001_09800 [Mycobacterium sp.]